LAQIHRGEKDAVAPSWSNSFAGNAIGLDKTDTRKTRRLHSGILWPVENMPAPQGDSADRQETERCSPFGDHDGAAHDQSESDVTCRMAEPSAFITNTC